MSGDTIHYESSGQPHPYHIVRPSPWPLLASLSAGVMMYGIVDIMHDKIWHWFIAGIVALLTVSALWFRDIISEASVEKAHTGIVQRLRQFAAYLLIAVVDPSVSRGLNFGVDAE